MKEKISITGLCILFTLFFMTACGQKSSEPVKLNKDDCAFCKMTIADQRFCAELITEKGRIYKFDDIKCMVGYSKENTLSGATKYYVSDYNKPHALVEIEKLTFVKGGKIESPMGGNIAAFKNKAEADKAVKSSGCQPVSWPEILNR